MFEVAAGACDQQDIGSGVIQLTESSFKLETTESSEYVFQRIRLWSWDVSVISSSV